MIFREESTMMMKTATTTAPTTQSEAAAAQAARSRLELLSNTAMLKTVMDNEQQKSSTTPVATQTKGAAAVVASPPTAAAVAKVVSRETLVQTPVENIQKPVVVVEKSSLSPEMTSPHQNSMLSPFATVTAGSSPGSTGTVHRATLTPASSYASLLAPSSGSVAGTPVALASTPTPAAFALPSLALAHLSPAMQMQMAMMATANTMYGSGPSSAFRKPYLPDTGTLGAPATVTASPSMDYTSRHASPTQSAGGQRAASYEALLQENLRLKQEASLKDETIASLQAKADGLEKQIVELRQLPTGKISHIPIEDMMRIMQEYGSEISNQTLPKRKQPIQKASIVRQFRRWNPEFFRYFVHVNGEWVPRLGRQGELKRRAEKRRSFIKSKTVGGVSPDCAVSN